MHASRKTARAMRCQSGSRFIVAASRLPRSAKARVEFQSEVKGAEEIVRREAMPERGQERQPQQHEEDDVAREDEQSAADHPEKLGATAVMNASMFRITRFESWLLKSNQSIKRSLG